VFRLNSSEIDGHERYTGLAETAKLCSWGSNHWPPAAADFVRQLRGPHLSTWPWCSIRSSMLLTAATSLNSFPQSSTGRFNAESGFMLRPDSIRAICSQVEGFSLRITGVAFSMAIN
jgi:hypothetical protein